MSRKNRRRKAKEAKFHRRSPPGSPPGTLIADPKASSPTIDVIAYNADRLMELRISDTNEIAPFVKEWPVTWINVTGLGDAAVIARIGEIFGLHRLALEDVINVHQRAKVEQFKDHCFIVVREISAEERFTSDQLSIFLGRNFVITFQETPVDPFDPVRERIRKSTGRIRTAGPDHLVYALIDATIDHYFPLLESYGEKLEALEEDVIAQPDRRCVTRIHDLRHGLLVLRRAVWPLREAVNGLYRESSALISEETRLYLRDCYDHTVQIIDLLENYRDVASSLMEAYLSSLSNRTNEIVKVLTIFTAVFIPLTLVAGIYGMNFHTERSPWNMPELDWFMGYPFALILMLAIALGMLLYFRRKGWLGPPRPLPSATDRSETDSPK
jgi:magnesium transporter